MTNTNAGISSVDGEGQLSTLTASLLLTLATLSWSGNHALARYIGAWAPSWSLNLARWLLVAVVIALFSWRTLKADWATIRKNWRILAFLGAVGGGVFSALQFVGLKYTGALNMGVLNSVTPALIAIASYLIFRDRIGWMQVIGITISLSGVVVIVSKLDWEVLRSLAFNRGDLIIVLNMGLWAVYSACLRLRPRMANASFLFALAVPAALVSLPFAAMEASNGEFLKPDALTLSTMTYSALISSIFAYICWGRGVETLGAARAGSFLHLVPLFGALLATTLLGERLGMHHLVGFALILCGVSLAVRPPQGVVD